MEFGSNFFLTQKSKKYISQKDILQFPENFIQKCYKMQKPSKLLIEVTTFFELTRIEVCATLSILIVCGSFGPNFHILIIIELQITENM